MSKKVVKKTPRKSQSWSLYKGMQIYKRPRSDFFYGCLRINNQYYRKSLGTEDKNEAERLLFQWKSELLSDPKSDVSEYKQSFKFFSEKLLKRQKLLPKPPSGVETHVKTKQLLQRPKGLWDFFGDQDIRSITRSKIEDFIIQLPLDNKPLSTNTIYKHTNLLSQILDIAEVNVDMPKVRGKKSQQRGYFDITSYKKIRKKSKDLVGFEYKMRNGSNCQIEEDLHDWIIFMVGSMLRPTVSEVYSLTHKDIEIKELNGQTYLEFLLMRKNQKQRVHTLPTSYYAYRDLCNRREGMKKDDYVFLPRYENRRTAMDYMSRMFSVLLKHLEMEEDKDGNKLTAYSLRHTAITFNLSVKEVDSLDIARRADTSMKMIDQYYYPRIAQDEKLKDFLRV